MILPFPSLEESIASLPITWVFRLNHIIGFELEGKYAYSPLGRCWKFHGFQLAEYALLAIERANKYQVNFYQHPWSAL